MPRWSQNWYVKKGGGGGGGAQCIRMLDTSHVYCGVVGSTHLPTSPTKKASLSRATGSAPASGEAAMFFGSGIVGSTRCCSTAGRNVKHGRCANIPSNSLCNRSKWCLFKTNIAFRAHI